MTLISSAIARLSTSYEAKPASNCVQQALTAFSKINLSTVFLGGSFFLESGPLFEAIKPQGPMPALLAAQKIQALDKGLLASARVSKVSLENIAIVAANIGNICKVDLYIKSTTGMGFSFDTKLVKEVADFVGNAISFFDMREIKAIFWGTASLGTDFLGLVAGVSKIVEIVAGKAFVLCGMVSNGASLVLRNCERLGLNKDKIGRVSRLGYYGLLASGGVQFVSAFVANYNGVQKNSSKPS